MRIVFMGTPSLAATVLRGLSENHEIVGVVTRPDAIRGRGSKTVPSPVKEEAVSLGIPVYERTSMRGDEARMLIEDLAPDAICVAACGIILPQEVLDIPPLGCFNVHTSLLPRWRGAAPIERAILECDETTGVCIMRMEAGLDTGPYCRRVEVPVAGKYVEELTEELANAGAEALLDALAEAESGALEWVDQQEDGVTYAEKIEKGELALDPADSACRNAAKVRASSKAHPARATVAGRALAIERADVVADDAGLGICSGLEPGSAKFAAKRLFLATEDGALEILGVRPDGKKSMDARSFAGGIQGIKDMQLTWGRA